MGKPRRCKQMDIASISYVVQKVMIAIVFIIAVGAILYLRIQL